MIALRPQAASMMLIRSESTTGRDSRARSPSNWTPPHNSFLVTPTVATEAASWAEVAPAPSVELRVAVALRSAAGELRAYSLRQEDRHLRAAEKQLDTAEAALDGEPVHNNPTDALRDQLENLQRSHQEQQLEVDEALEDF